MRRVRHAVSKSRSPAAEPSPLGPAATALATIHALAPLGWRAEEERLIAEVAALAGRRYARENRRPGLVRWGQQPGSVYLADQKQRWCAVALLDMERQCRRVKGHAQLPLLYRALRATIPQAIDDAA